MTARPSDNAASNATAVIDGWDRSSWLGAGGMVLSAMLAVVAYAPSSSGAFVRHDEAVLSAAGEVEPGTRAPAWWSANWPVRESVHFFSYRPVTLATIHLQILIERHVFQCEPLRSSSFRQVNMGLHALIAALAAMLAWRWLGVPAAALVAGPIFAVHPIHTEVVLTVYGRAELLATLFGAVLLLRFVCTHEPGRRGACFHVLNMALFALMALSHEWAVLLWPILLLIDVDQARRTREAGSVAGAWRRRLAGHVGLVWVAVGVLVWFAFREWDQPGSVLSPDYRWIFPMVNVSLSEALFTPFGLLALTGRLLACPDCLCPVWSVASTLPAAQMSPAVWGGLGLAGIAVGAGFVGWWYRWPMSPAIWGMLVLMAPAVHALPIADVILAARWVYLPMVLLAVVLGGLGGRLRLAGVSAGLVVSVWLLSATWAYGPVYADDLTLAREVVFRQPDNYQGRHRLAVLLYERGEYVEAIQVAQEAVQRFQRDADWIQRFGPIVAPYRVLVRSYLALGDTRRAREVMEAIEQRVEPVADTPGASIPSRPAGLDPADSVRLHE